MFRLLFWTKAEVACFILFCLEADDGTLTPLVARQQQKEFWRQKQKHCMKNNKEQGFRTRTPTLSHVYVQETKRKCIQRWHSVLDCILLRLIPD